jgi:hypothetical protein
MFGYDSWLANPGVEARESPGRRGAKMHTINDSDQVRWLAAVALLITGVLLVGYWGFTHRPVRSRTRSLPATATVVEQPGGGASLATPTLGLSDVYVYTLDGETVCSGYPVGDLGFELRCAVPEGVRLFRVVDADGNSTLAVRYNEQVVIRVGDDRAR